MEIKRVGSQPSAKGRADWFTGTVRIDPLFTAPDPALVAGASVTFEPAARTAWHTHPSGQRSSSPQEAAGYSVKVDQSRRTQSALRLCHSAALRRTSQNDSG